MRCRILYLLLVELFCYVVLVSSVVKNVGMTMTRDANAVGNCRRRFTTSFLQPVP